MLAAWNQGISPCSGQSGPGEETANLLGVYEDTFLNISLPGFFLEICVPETQRLKRGGGEASCHPNCWISHTKSKEILSAKEHVYQPEKIHKQSCRRAFLSKKKWL